MNSQIEKLGRYMRYMRMKKGLSQRKLAKIIGIDHSTISDFENGIIKKIDFFIVVKMCYALSIDIEDLLDYFEFNLLIDEEFDDENDDIFSENEEEFTIFECPFCNQKC